MKSGPPAERPEQPERREQPEGRLHRRGFLQGSAAAVGALTLGLEARANEDDDTAPRVKRYGVLGRTGLRIPDISFGSGGTTDAALVSYALERGITYFDTAESYPMGNPGVAERVLGRALRGKRDQVVLASKTVAKAGDDRKTLMGRLEKTLRRLETEHVDVYFNHAVNDPARLRNPEWAEFCAQARQQGKILWVGMSGHAGRLVECLGLALEEDQVDVILVAHNFGSDPRFYERLAKRFDFVANQQGLPPLLAKAHEQGVGVLAMKTLMGARLNDMRPYEWGGASFAQAAFRWVLSSPHVDGVVVSMKSRAQIDEYLAASGSTGLRPTDARLLKGYLAANGATQCRPACDACEGSCPHGVPVADVLRARMYERDYRAPRTGRLTYAGLGAGAAPCLDCAHQACLGACPYGLAVPALTRAAHDALG